VVTHAEGRPEQAVDAIPVGLLTFPPEDELPTDDAFLVEVGNTTRRTPPQRSGSAVAHRAQHSLLPEREALSAPLPPPPSAHSAAS
jgi:hypothetical protein